MTKEYMTLDEWESKMKAEGRWKNFSAKQAKRDAEFEVKAARLLQEQEAILADLQRAGCPVTSIWDLAAYCSPKIQKPTGQTSY